MKILVDFFPVIAFFAAFYAGGEDIFLATSAAIAASCIQIGATWALQRRVENMHLLTFLLILVLGGATLLLHDETFIKWKPTAVNWLFAVVFLGSQYVGGRPLVRRMLESSVSVPDKVWVPLNLGWVAFFLLVGVLNLYVAFNFSNEVWVNFKLFGVLGLTLLFAVAQAAYLSRYMDDGDGGTPPGTERPVKQ
jgi:intracellular septation protein